jgi:hypothetical protein
MQISKPLYVSKEISLHSIHQVIAEQFYNWHWHKYEILQTKVEKSNIVFDCGCAEGIFPLMIHDKCKMVYAFEPLNEYVSGLKKTFIELKNVTIINEALGDKVGHVGFIKSGINSSISEEIN